MFGKHLVLDLFGCEKSVITSRKKIYDFTVRLVDMIKMKSFGEPLIEHFAKENPEAAGYTVVQLIETSSITGHFVDKSGDSYLDIFSCKNFDTDTVTRFVEHELSPVSIKTRTILRG